MVSSLLLRTVDRSTRGAMLSCVLNCVLIVTLAAAAGITRAGTLSPTEQALLKQSSPGAWEARRQYRDIAVYTVGTGETRAYVFRP